MKIFNQLKKLKTPTYKSENICSMIMELNLESHEILYALILKYYARKKEENFYKGEKPDSDLKGVQVKWAKLPEDLQNLIAKYVLVMNGKLALD